MPKWKINKQSTGQTMIIEWPTEPTEQESQQFFVEEESKPTWLGGLAKEFPRTAGGMLGGAYGTAAGGPLGGLLGIGVGALAGQGLEEARKTIIGEKPLDPVASVKNMFMAGIEEPAYELLGGGAAKGLGWLVRGARKAPVIGKVLAPFSHTVTPEARQAIDFLSDKMRTPFLPAEATTSRALDIAENIAEGSFLGGGVVSNLKLERDRILNKMVNELVDEFGQKMGKDEFGELFSAVVERRLRAEELLAKPLYNNVADIINKKTQQMFSNVSYQYEKVEPMFWLGDLKKKAYEVLSMSKELGGLGDDLSGANMARKVAQMNDSVPYSVAQKLRSRLIKIGKELQGINPKAEAVSLSDTFVSMTDDAIERTLKKEVPEAYDVWREANNIYRTAKETYDNKFIKALMRKADPVLGGDPETIANSIIKYPGRIERIRHIKKVFAKDPDGMESFRSLLMTDVVGKSTKNEVLNGQALHNNLFGRSGLGEKFIAEAFDHDTVNYLKKITNALKVSQAQKPGGPGGILIQLKQSGAIAEVGGALLTSGGIGAGRPILWGPGAFIMLGPGVLGRIMTNPTTAKLLIDGIKVGPKAQKYLGIGARLTSMVERNEARHKSWLLEEEAKEKGWLKGM